jgi:hypothetical protein
MALFSKRSGRPAVVATSAAVSEIVATGQEANLCASLLEDFRTARDDDTAQDDRAIRGAARAIAHAGGGAPISGQLSLAAGGASVSERTWRWLAACAHAAVAQGEELLPIRIAIFAMEWTDEIAPASTVADFGDMGLLSAPQAVLREILAASVVAAWSLNPQNLIWMFQGRRVVAGMAAGIHASRLSELDPGGESLARAEASSARAASDRAATQALPADVLARMAAYGQASWNLEHEIFESGPFDEELGRLRPEAQAAWVSALSDEVLPAGGWALYGAAEVLMKALGHPVHLESYCAILDASLQFQRDAGVWDSQLSPNERLYWQERHPEEIWLPRREAPSCESATITPLAVGDERKLGAVTRRPDSNAIYVIHPEHKRYVWLLDYPDSSSATGGRLREERGTFGDLYDLYRALGQNSPLPGLWVHPELEPFLPFPAPRL